MTEAMGLSPAPRPAPHRGGVSPHDRRAIMGCCQRHSAALLWRRWSPSGATPPTDCPRPETRIGNPSPGVRLWMDANLTSARWRRHQPFNYGCSPGLSVVPSDGATAWGLCPSSRSSSPVQGPAELRPVPGETFALPRTMPKYTLQRLRRFETAESGGGDTTQSGRLRAPPTAEAVGFRAWRATL